MGVIFLLSHIPETLYGLRINLNLTCLSNIPKSDLTVRLAEIDNAVYALANAIRRTQKRMRLECCLPDSNEYLLPKS